MARRCAAVGCGILVGLAVAILAPWLVLNFCDTDLLKIS